MDSFAKILYEKFFMRDVLGKLGPGAIATLLLLYAVEDPKSTTPMHDIFKGELAYFFIALPLFYMVGVSLQISAEVIGFHSASSYPRYVCFVRSTGKWAMANKDFDDRLALIRSAPSDKWTDGAKEQRERFVYLKEGSGNMAIALLVAAVSLCAKSQTSISLLAGIFAIMLYISHRLHAKRQGRFEVNVLRNSGLLEPEKADAMLERI